MTVLKILTYALVSTWSLVSSGWEHVKRRMHPWQSAPPNTNHYRLLLTQYHGIYHIKMSHFPLSTSDEHSCTLVKFCQFMPRNKIGMDICDCIDLIITHFNSLKVPTSPFVTLEASVWVTKFKCFNSGLVDGNTYSIHFSGLEWQEILHGWLLSHLLLKLPWIVWSPSITQILQFGTLADLAKTLTPLGIF